MPPSMSPLRENIPMPALRESSTHLNYEPGFTFQMAYLYVHHRFVHGDICSQMPSMEWIEKTPTKGSCDKSLKKACLTYACVRSSESHFK